MATIQERVQERYPSLVSLLREPEIGPLLTRAVQENWSPGVFQSKFMASRWFRSQSEPQRRWWVTANTDPGEANRQRKTYHAGLQTSASRLGVSLTAAELKWITEVGLQQGIAPDSQESINGLLEFAARHRGRITVGAWGTETTRVRNMLTNDWLMPPSKGFSENWGRYLASGQKSIEDLQGWAQQQAAKRYPHMRAELAAGMTVADVIGGNVAVYAEEYDMDPSQVMQKVRTDPWIRQLLGVRDPKSGKTRLPTEMETMKMARSTPSWWKTSKGRQADAQTATTLAQVFGKRAGTGSS